MSSQNIAVDVCCFNGEADIQKLLDELRESDPVAYMEAMDVLKNADWEAVRQQVVKESLQALAKEMRGSFYEGQQAQNILDGSSVPPEEASGTLVGIVSAYSGVQFGVTMEPNKTCKTFGVRRDSANRRGEDTTTIYKQKPEAQARFEELHRDHMAKAVVKILFGTDADHVEVLPDKTIIMRFPLEKEEV